MLEEIIQTTVIDILYEIKDIKEFMEKNTKVLVPFQNLQILKSF